MQTVRAYGACTCTCLPGLHYLRYLVVLLCNQSILTNSMRFSGQHTSTRMVLELRMRQQMLAP